jgi:hypothetical protein
MESYLAKIRADRICYCKIHAEEVAGLDEAITKALAGS